MTSVRSVAYHYIQSFCSTPHVCIHLYDSQTMFRIECPVIALTSYLNYCNLKTLST